MTMVQSGFSNSSPARSQTYTRTAIVLHWLVATFILLNFAIGLCMEHFPGYPHKSSEWNGVLFWHGSFGALVLWLAITRLIWRSTHRPPALPQTVSVWQQRAAHTVHALLYVLMIFLPLSGLAHRWAGNHAVTFFGLWNWQSLISPDEPTRVLTGTIHISLVFILGGLVLMHVVAVVKHLLIDRDGVAQRMLGRKTK
jgi:cytochrome b561